MSLTDLRLSPYSRSGGTVWVAEPDPGGADAANRMGFTCSTIPESGQGSSGETVNHLGNSPGGAAQGVIVARSRSRLPSPASSRPGEAAQGRDIDPADPGWCVEGRLSADLGVPSARNAAAGTGFGGWRDWPADSSLWQHGGVGQSTSRRLAPYAPASCRDEGVEATSWTAHRLAVRPSIYSMGPSAGPFGPCRGGPWTVPPWSTPLPLSGRGR